ncbi:MAG: cupin domain-containing protein [Candidatus Thiodiazotropha sp.]
MNVFHHPSAETLVAHAAGTLDPVLMPVVSLHLDHCEQCSQQQRLAAQMGAALFAQPADEPMPPFDLERGLAAVKRRIVHPPPPAANTPDFLGRFSPAALQQVMWHRVTPKIEMFEIPELSGGDHWMRLFRFQPGTRVPHHRHAGEEFSLVLQGSYIEADACYATGDFSEADTTTRHAQQVDSDIACIALIATTGKIAFDNLPYRWASRLLGLV